MNDQHLLEARLTALEARHRRTRRGLVVASVLALSLGLVAAKRPAPSVVDAKAFVLVDDTGRSRAQLALTEDGSVNLILTAPQGSADAGMTVLADGSVALRLKNAKRTGTIEITPNGTARMRFNQANSKTAVELGIDEAGRPRLVLNDGLGKVVHQAP